jgi:Inorganic Pyrophosphatase
MNTLQKSANSIKKILQWKRLPIGIEFEPGDKKHGHATMKNASYGHIRGTWGKGEDGMSIDVYVGPDLGSDRIFKLSQIFPDTGEFDESKYIIGCWDADEAKALYLAHMPKRFFGSIKPIPFAELKPYQKLKKYAIAGTHYTFTNGKLTKATVRTPVGTGVLIQEKPKYPTTGKDHGDLEGAIAATVKDAYDRHGVHIPGVESKASHRMTPVMHLEMNRHVIEHLDKAKELGVPAFHAPPVPHSIDRTEKPLRVKYDDPAEEKEEWLKGGGGVYDSLDHTIHLFTPRVHLNSIKELKEHERASASPSEYKQYAKDPTIKPQFVDPGETFAHELSHALHHNNLVPQNKYELFEQGLSKKYKGVARSHLSRYGATDKAEFVAETGTQILTGQEVHPEAMNLYRQFGGPMVKVAGINYEFQNEKLVKVPCGRSYIPKTKKCTKGRAVETPKERLQTHAEKARQDKGLRSRAEVKIDRDMGDRTLAKPFHQMSLDELIEMHQKAVSKAKEQGKTDIHPDNLKSVPSGGVGDRIRSIADNLKSEKQTQIKATSRIIGAAGEMASNYDRLVDEVVESIEEDLASGKTSKEILREKQSKVKAITDRALSRFTSEEPRQKKTPFPKATEDPLLTSIVDLDSITLPRPLASSLEQKINKQATLIAALGGITNPVILRQTGIDAYDLIAGDQDYYAYLKARTLNSNLPDRISSYILNDAQLAAFKESGIE